MHLLSIIGVSTELNVSGHPWDVKAGISIFIIPVLEEIGDSSEKGFTLKLPAFTSVAMLTWHDQLCWK